MTRARVAAIVGGSTIAAIAITTSGLPGEAGDVVGGGIGATFASVLVVARRRYSLAAGRNWAWAWGSLGSGIMFLLLTPFFDGGVFAGFSIGAGGTVMVLAAHSPPEKSAQMGRTSTD